MESIRRERNNFGLWYPRVMAENCAFSISLSLPPHPGIAFEISHGWIPAFPAPMLALSGFSRARSAPHSEPIDGAILMKPPVICLIHIYGRAICQD